ncbi:MAG: hypothetical protein LUC99_04510 [Clostridiales bacterium]|nr:hypothetical protein [Clostridiales bacterium]
MKRFLIRLLPFFVWIALLMVALPMVIDPYNVFHWNHLRDNGIEPNKNFLKMEYILHNPDKFDAFLFGSSRVSAIHTDLIEGYRCYNMTYSEGVPREHLENLQVMLEHGICPRMVMIGVDSVSCMVDPEFHKGDRLRCPYPMTNEARRQFYLLYLEPIMAVESLETTLFGVQAVTYDQKIYDVGWNLDYGLISSYDWSQAVGDWTELYANRVLQALEEIRQIKELCDANGIDLIVFTNPMHHLTYEKVMENGYRDFLEGLAQITDYYNFSGINDITINNDNYLETSHYRAELGDRILDAIFKNQVDLHLLEQGFDYKVTSDNCEEFLRNYIDGHNF